MAGRGDGIGVGIMTIDKPGPLLLQTLEASFAEQVFPLQQIIAAHLVEDEDDAELGLAQRWLGGGVGERQANEAADEQGSEEGSALPHGRFLVSHLLCRVIDRTSLSNNGGLR
jgi:hypothetical protein